MKSLSFILSIILSIICLEAIDIVQIFNLNFLDTIKPHFLIELSLYMIFFIPLFLLGKGKNIKNVTAISIAAICGALVFVGFSLYNSHYLTFLPALLKLIMTLVLPFILWNHLNHFYTVKEALKDYLMIPILFATFLGFGLGLSGNLPKTAPFAYFFIFGAIASLGAAIYFALMGSDEVTEEGVQSNTSRPNLFKLSCFLTLPVALQHFLLFIFKHKMKVLHKMPADYSSMMGIYSKLSLFSSLTLLILTLYYASRYLKKYDAFSLLSRAAIFMSIIASFGFVFFSSPNMFTLAPIVLTTTSISCFVSFLAFPLIQLIYLSFPAKDRTKAKIWTEVIFYKPMIMLPSLMIQGVMVLTGSVSFVPVFASTAALLIIVSLFLMARGRMKPALV